MNKKTKQLLYENNLFEKTLNKENREVLTDIVVYLRDCDISEYQQEEVRRDIMNMLTDGETRNEDARAVIGDDYKKFCNEIVISLPPISFREKALLMFTGLLSNISVLLVIYLVRAFVGGLINKTSVTVLPLTVGDLINGILIIFIATMIIKFVCKTSFSKKRKGKIKSFLVTWIISVVVIGAMAAIAHFLPMVVINLHILFVVGALIALYLASYAIENNIGE